MKITLHLLALCLLLSITTKVSGKPNPRHLLIETEEQAKAKNNDDYQNSQIMTGNDIRGGSVSQDQSNGGGWGGGSHNTQAMSHDPMVTENANGGGYCNDQMHYRQHHPCASVSQTQSNGGGFPW